MTAKHSPATPLPLKLAVQWEDTFVRLHTIGSNPYDCAIGSSRDSTRGKLFTVIADRCNAYPKLVEALAKVVGGMTMHEEQDALGRCLGTWSESDRKNARALLRELGEAE